MGDLERETRLDGAAGDYRACLAADREIWGPNGGYTASTTLAPCSAVRAREPLADADAEDGKVCQGAR